MSINTEIYNDLIKDLNQKHAEALALQQTPTGNKLEVHTNVAQNMVTQRNYEVELKRLIDLRNESMPISPGVQNFIAPKITEGKMDVLAGTAKIDNSMEPLGGKKV